MSSDGSNGVPRPQRSGGMDLSASEVLRIARFAVNGLFNTGLSYLLFVVMLHAGLPVFASLLLATIISVVFNYQTSCRLVFRSTRSGLMLRFLLAYVALFLLDYICLIGLATWGLPHWFAQALVTLVVAPLTYLAQRNLVFQRAARAGLRRPIPNDAKL